MRIQVNDEPRETLAETLAELLRELDLEGAVVATAVNGVFVPVSQRAAREICAEDRIEVLAPMQGG